MTAARHFYVSMIEQPRWWCIAVPYPTHEEALVAVATAKRKAIAADPFKHFAAFGTCSEDGPPRATTFGIVRPEAWTERVACAAQGELAL